MTIKRKTILGIAGMALAFLILAGCSKKDDNKPEEPEETKLQIEGEWNLESIDFLSTSIAWDEEVPFAPQNTIGYAPFMLSQVHGYNFRTDKTHNEELGLKLDVVQGFYTDYDDSQDLWYWNYIDDGESVEMVQVNLEFPPYDFGIHNISKIEETEKDKIELTAEVQSRKVGGTMMESDLVPVRITLVKETPVPGVDMFLNGEPFELPQ